MDSEAGAPPLPLAPGQVIDGFRLEEKLHQGGMAVLWSVTRAEGGTGDGMPLIMKVPRIKGGEDPATIGFEVEQIILPALSGVHVPQYVARGDFTRQPYIVMERIPGATLRPRLEAARSASTRWSRWARASPPPCTTSTAAPRPPGREADNILFRPDGNAVLVDFGLSRHDKLPDLLEEEFTCRWARARTCRPSRSSSSATTRAAICSRSASCCSTSRPASALSAPPRRCGLRRRLFVD